jgi:hypothetical protein
MTIPVSPGTGNDSSSQESPTIFLQSVGAGTMIYGVGYGGTRGRYVAFLERREGSTTLILFY